MNEEKLEVELERLAKLLRQLPEVEEEVDRCEEALDAARSNVEYVRSGIAEVRARVCNLLMPPNIVVAGPALTPVSEEKDEGLLADQQDTPPQSNAQASETDAAEEDPTAVAIAAYIEAENADTPTDAERTSVVTDQDRVDQTNTDTVAAVDIPEGFIPWESGYCPFGIGTHVEVLTRKNGVWPVVIKPEAPLLWEHEGHDLDIIAYKVISEPAKASEAPSELKTQAEVGGDRVAPHDLPALSDEAFNALPKLDDTAVIDAEPPTIPRSEIPEGVAVETFTEQGVETVKIGGLTHIVEGEAPVEKFSATRDGGEAGFWAAARGLTKIEEMA